jgi:hypothetical protein
MMEAAFPQFNAGLSSNTEPVGWSDYTSLKVKVNKRSPAAGCSFDEKESQFISTYACRCSRISTAR